MRDFTTLLQLAYKSVTFWTKPCRMIGNGRGRKGNSMRRILIFGCLFFLICACATDAAPSEKAYTLAPDAPPQTDVAAASTPDASPSALPGDAPASTDPVPEEGLCGDRFPDRFSDAPILTEDRYRSKSIDVTVTRYTEKDTYAKIVTYYVADVYVQDVTSIRTAAARGDFNTRYTRYVKDIASDLGALLAIDGDSYTHMKNSFVIRNGELYRDTPIEDTDLCVLYRDGRMETKPWGTFTGQEIIDSDPWQVWGFGPALLDEAGKAMQISHELSGHNPRAAIGYYEPGHYCFVIVDGRREGWSEGMRLSALSQLMEDLGCKAAYNLDGGASAQMYWNGGIINSVCGKNRTISDIIYLLPEE